jgi:hypothetical protein
MAANNFDQKAVMTFLFKYRSSICGIRIHARAAPHSTYVKIWRPAYRSAAIFVIPRCKGTV